MSDDSSHRVTYDFDFDDLEQAVNTAGRQMEAEARVASVCDMLARSKRRVEDLEESLARAKAEQRMIEEEQLPKLLAEMGFERVSTANGTTVEIVEQVHASLPKEDAVKRAQALRWLEDNGHSAVIKIRTTIEMGKGDVDTAKALAAHVAAFDRRELVDVTETRDVHPQTLAALIRQEREEEKRAGIIDGIPIDLLGGHVRRVARVKQAKK